MAFPQAQQTIVLPMLTWFPRNQLCGKHPFHCSGASETHFSCQPPHPLANQIKTKRKNDTLSCHHCQMLGLSVFHGGTGGCINRHNWSRVETQPLNSPVSFPCYSLLHECQHQLTFNGCPTCGPVRGRFYRWSDTTSVSLILSSTYQPIPPHSTHIGVQAAKYHKNFPKRTRR